MWTVELLHMGSPMQPTATCYLLTRYGSKEWHGLPFLTKSAQSSDASSLHKVQEVVLLFLEIQLTNKTDSPTYLSEQHIT
ncbi:hypothetical protein EJB05_55122 [Eragrostis curvula]|uniref:Uncharacterized protein n=1 Tax=Eragrostis curvula TaxID=38414 RepID=A0A5J9SKK9_9POAL|nr:hypothetical protein EJB05_55122 [Eragrostis curvula]